MRTAARNATVTMVVAAAVLAGAFAVSGCGTSSSTGDGGAAGTRSSGDSGVADGSGGSGGSDGSDGSGDPGDSGDSGGDSDAWSDEAAVLAGDGATTDSPNDSGVAWDGGMGSGTTSGSGDGIHPFGSVASAFWIGRPDPDNSGAVVTTVVYLLSVPWSCGDMTPGWDTRLPGGTQVIELKMAWAPSVVPPTVFPAIYAITGGNAAKGATPPSPGHAFGLWAITPIPATGETPASAGDATLTALNAGNDATGTFSLMYGASSLTGSFDAAWCPTGREP